MSPVFDISNEIVDEVSSTASPRDAFFVCRLVSKDADRCPFEVHFGRGPETGRFNFFLGLGAEFYNNESLPDSDSRVAAKRDLDLFLRSAVRCERVIGRKGIAVEHYWPSELLIDKSPMHFTYRKYYPWRSAVTEVIDYRPWIT